MNVRQLPWRQAEPLENQGRQQPLNLSSVRVWAQRPEFGPEGLWRELGRPLCHPQPRRLSSFLLQSTSQLLDKSTEL